MKENPIKVLHIVRYLGQGGIQNLLLNLYRNIDRNKIQFDFLVCSEGVFDEEVKKLGGKIHRMHYITQVGELRYKKELKEFLLNHKEYKIVHSHLNEVSGPVMQVCKSINIPVRIAHSHNIRNSNKILQKLYKMYLKTKINDNATDLFACSKEAAKWLFKEKSEQAIILNNAIDMERFEFSEEDRNSIRDELGIEKECTVIGNIGKISDQKNQLFVLEVFKEYREKNKNSILILIGEGKEEEEEKVKQKIKKLELDNFVIKMKPIKQIEKYYSAFDYFLFPSKYEGLGMVLIEAQASGLKCFASDIVIPKTTKITENITYIDLNQLPFQWAEQIPNDNCYERANIKIEKDSYDIKKIVKQLEEFYENKMKNLE